MRPLVIMTVIAFAAVLVTASAPVHMASAAPLTRAACEAAGSFIWIEAGPFVSGSDTAERDAAYTVSAQAASATPAEVAGNEQNLRERAWFDDEAPLQTATLDSLCIARFPVTNAEYARFIASTGHRVPHISEAEYLRQGFLVHPYAEVVPYLWLNGRFPAGTDRHPVVLVSRDDTVAYALWKGQQDGATYRLPSSLEWEKAARGTDGRAYPWGAKWRPDASNAAPTGLNHTSPVDAFPGGRSPYGTEGMGGNVFEFTSSDDPDGRTVMKGCGWDDLPGFCRAAYQHTRAAGSRHILFGFRLVAE